MTYGVNSPNGLQVRGHLLGGGTAIKENDNYSVGRTSGRLNKGDPVIMSASSGDYVATDDDMGNLPPIAAYVPGIVLAAANTRTDVTTDTQMLVGVFQGCKFEVNGKYVEQEYWIPGTVTSSIVRAIIIDDPYVIWSIQLGSYNGAEFGTPTEFMLLPCLQLQTANWPNTGTGGPKNPVMANSGVLGTNIQLMTGSNVRAAAGVNSSATIAGVVINGVVQNYRDNPLIANQGTALGNPLGVSTFYACPSLAITNANPTVVHGGNEYDRSQSNLTVMGFDNDPRNIPGKFGIHPTNPALPAVGTYYNTPFLNVLVTINAHVNKAPTKGIVLI